MDSQLPPPVSNAQLLAVLLDIKGQLGETHAAAEATAGALTEHTRGDEARFASLTAALLPLQVDAGVAQAAGAAAGRRSAASVAACVMFVYEVAKQLWTLIHS